MAYGLRALWNKESSITYANTEASNLRESDSVEESASFLVRWAAELFGGWASWMRHKLPGCQVSAKQSTLRIVNKIKELHDRKEIQRLGDGWERLTDLLRASYNCSTT